MFGWLCDPVNKVIKQNMLRIEAAPVLLYFATYAHSADAQIHQPAYLARCFIGESEYQTREWHL